MTEQGEYTKMENAKVSKLEGKLNNTQTSPKRRNAPYIPPTNVEKIAYQICVSIK